MTVRIVTDSTCDLPAEVISRLQICLLPIYIHIGNRDFLDGIDISREEFYRNLPNYPEHPATAVPSPAKFHAIYNELVEEGASEVLSIHISSTLSGIADVARTAAKEISSAVVTVFDFRQLSLGTGFLVQTAAELAMRGLKVKEILPILNDQIKRTYVAAGLDTLKYLRRSGRMHVAIATIGELIHIKPILMMYDGVSKVERVRTNQKAIARLADLLRSHAPYEKVAFLYSGETAPINALINQARDLLGGLNPIQEIINPVLGAHIGPNVAGFACVTAKSAKGS